MTRRFSKRSAFLIFSMLAGVACGSADRVFAPPTETLSQLYWTLEINHPAIRLAMHSPYDTVTVVADPYAPNGIPWFPATAKDTLDATAPTLWYSTDSVRVRVTQDGLIRAYAETGSTVVYVVAKRTIGKATHSDSTLVQVTQIANPPVLRTFTARPTDSLKRSVGSVLLLRPQFRDSSDNVLTGFPVHYQSSNEKLAKGSTPWSSSLMFSSLISPVMGRTLVRARTFVYGVAKSDTFTIEAGYPIAALVAPRAELRLGATGNWEPYLVGAVVHLGPGATLAFGNHTGRTVVEAEKSHGQPVNGLAVSYIFDEPDSIMAALSPSQNTGGGNILDILGDTLAAWSTRNRYRRFPVPGRYEYTVQPFGFRGVVVIHDR